MPKVDPFSLKRPIPLSATRTFRDSAQPGIELTLGLRALDAPERTFAMEVAEDMAERYLGSRNRPAAMAFPAIDGRAVLMSRTLCASAATLVAMQTNPGPEAYTFEDFVAISATMPEAWLAILTFSQEIDCAEAGQEPPGGNASGAPTAMSSSAS